MWIERWQHVLKLVKRCAAEITECVEITGFQGDMKTWMKWCEELKRFRSVGSGSLLERDK